MQMGLSAYDASVLVAEKESADYFEAMLAAGADAKAAANWLNNEYFGRLNKAGLAIADGPVSAAANSAIVQMVAANVISGKIAKDVLDIVWSEGGDPRAIVESARPQAGDRHAARSRRRSTPSSPRIRTRSRR